MLLNPHRVMTKRRMGKGGGKKVGVFPFRLCEPGWWVQTYPESGRLVSRIYRHITQTWYSRKDGRLQIPA